MVISFEKHILGYLSSPWETTKFTTWMSRQWCLSSFRSEVAMAIKSDRSFWTHIVDTLKLNFDQGLLNWDQLQLKNREL